MISRFKNGQRDGVDQDPIDTLTDPPLSRPGSLLKTTPLPPGYPWVSRGQYVTPEPRFRGLVLDHQFSKELEPKNCSKIAKFDQNSTFWGFFSTSTSKP